MGWCRLNSFKRKCVLAFLVMLLILWAEFGLFYLSILQCKWPPISEKPAGISIPDGDASPAIKVLLITDTHIGPYKYWIDKVRRLWLLKRAFQTSIGILQPDVVVHLGDLLDQGFFEHDESFKTNVKAAKEILAVDPRTTVFKVVPGNHDIGFHHRLHPYTYQRFSRAFLNASSASPVTIWTHKSLVFVFTNSMTFKGDGCGFCQRTDAALLTLSKYLQCLRGELDQKSCRDDFTSILDPGSDATPVVYSTPILMQHFPLHRPDETVCDNIGPDSMPKTQRKTPYGAEIDCLSAISTEQLLRLVRPRLVFGGHTHYHCQRNHTVKLRSGKQFKVEEWTLPALSYRVTTHPGFALLHVSSTDHAVRRCLAPSEITIGLNYLVGLLVIGFILYFSQRDSSTTATKDLREQKRL